MVAPLHAVTRLNDTFAWGPEQQQAFIEIKKALIEAGAFAQLDTVDEFVLATDVSAVAISGILHMWQGPRKNVTSNQLCFASKKLNATKAKYGALRLRCMLPTTLLSKPQFFVFILIVDNQALSWLKTCSSDQAMIER